MKPFNDIDLHEYDYSLPEDRIASFPLQHRDDSQILVKKPDGSVAIDVFRNLSKFIPKGSCMVFNYSRVIPARLIFRKSTGSSIELLCLSPVDPSDHQMAMQALGGCTWECMAGNKRRFKGNLLQMEVNIGESGTILSAEKLSFTGNTIRIRFSWNNSKLSFAEILASAGRTPLPPYIKRPDEEIDKDRYQTIYSQVEGSVAAPTAGLHFTRSVMEKLRQIDVQMLNITLHVGAGTFLPIKSQNVHKHDMHAEYISVSYECIRALQNAKGPVIAVGTTAARTIESLYRLGTKAPDQLTSLKRPLYLDQWESYGQPSSVSPYESLENLMNWMKKNGQNQINAYTKLMIIPGYRFSVIDALLTNFHQPRSTLLLLLAAFTGESWKDLYQLALDNKFRFLSYGDTSLLFRQEI